MRLLVYGLNYAPELTGIGKYTAEMAENLASLGHEVRVASAPPYYPEWRIYPGYVSFTYKREQRSCSAPSVYRCPLWVPQRPSGFKRLLHLASFALSSFPVALRQAFWRPDIIIVIAPALFCAPGAWLVARLCGAKAWLHIQDFEIDAAFSLGILRSSLLRRAITLFEGFIMRRFDRVSTISANMLQQLAEKGVAGDRRLLFPNWVDTAKIHPPSTISPFRARLGFTDETIVVLYSGNMGEKQGLDILLDAAAQLAKLTHIHFLMCGDGAVRARLAQQYAHLGNITWLDLQPLEALNDLLNAADIHALPQRADAADLVSPPKPTGLMASGRPTVAAAAAGNQDAQ